MPLRVPSTKPETVCDPSISPFRSPGFVPEEEYSGPGPGSPRCYSGPRDAAVIFGEGSERRQRERAMREAGRLPPGQSLTLKWPVLHAGSVPAFDPSKWDFGISGLVEQPLRLSWQEFSSLPMREVIADMHCVTRWSRFDVRWEGVPFTEIARLAHLRPEAHYVMVLAEYGYTSNVPLDDLMRPTTLFALKHNGEPLPADHGYPVRLVVPHLYAWKSVKWVRGVEFLEHDAPGFWEQNGYHLYGDPFREQRYSSG